MIISPWHDDPTAAYAQWQAEEAAGADRRPFAAQSIVQHKAMFARFLRYLVAHGQTVATFGPDHVDGFFLEIGPECVPGTTTQIRYLKLLDRLGRHLRLHGVRTGNPAEEMLRRRTWPDDEPEPVYLGRANDHRLQESLTVGGDTPFKSLRNTAVVAALLATGITAAECRQLTVDDLLADDIRPAIHVSKHGPRIARTVPIDGFAIALLQCYKSARLALSRSSGWLFIATAAGKPMKDATLGQCVRAALTSIEISASDMSPRLLRNTYCRRHLLGGRSNETVSQLLGLSSHRTVARIRATIAPDDVCAEENAGTSKET